jgi:hypothetical protein
MSSPGNRPPFGPRGPNGPNGPTSRSSGGPAAWNSDTPPDFEPYSDEPRYDFQTIVSQVNVRPMILWGWEQQLGVPMGPRAWDEAGMAGRRYSERDLVALLWLREQIVNGKSPGDAASLLHQALRRGPQPHAPRTTQPLREEPDAGELPDDRAAPSVEGGSPQLFGSGSARPLTDRLSNSTLPPSANWFERENLPNMRRSPVTLPLAREHGDSIPAWISRPSRPSLPNMARGEGGASAEVGSGPGPTPLPGPELRALLQYLLRAFVTFDTAGANRVIELARANRNVESLCLGLLQPALAEVREKWSRREMSSPEERFAQQYVRSFLFSVFHTGAEQADAPLVIVACAPREFDESGALTQAVFWRRAHFRVAYLGPDIEGGTLIDEMHKKRPALVSLHVASAQRVRTLARLSKDFAKLGAPRPIFAFNGAIFARNPELQKKVQGVYLGDDAWQATWHLKNLLVGGREAVAVSGVRYQQPWHNA